MYDVIVIGVGSMGSSVCYHIASRGAKVLGLEQFGISHENGSHSGESRLVRKAYFEHIDYVPLLQKAYHGWLEIEKKSKKQLYWKSGIAYFGLPECDMLSGVRKSAKLYNIPIHHFSNDQIKKKWPQFDLKNKHIGVLEPEAGFLTPESAIKTFVDLAVDRGAVIHDNEKVLEWSLDATLKVTTSKGTYNAKKIIFTAGAFTAELIKTKAKLKVTQQFMGWTSTVQSRDYHLGTLPCWMISEEGNDGPYYGFPELKFNKVLKGMKVAYHREGEELNDTLDLNTLEKKEEMILNELLKKYFPEVKSSISLIKRCLYTYSPDQDFIVDQLPEFDNKIILAAGFSGHGFKFAPVVGEALADLALNGGSDLPIEFLGLNRF